MFIQVKARSEIINVSDMLISASEVLKKQMEHNERYHVNELVELDYSAEEVYLLTDYLSKKLLLNDITPRKYNIIKHLADFLLITLPFNAINSIIFNRITNYLISDNADTDNIVNVVPIEHEYFGTYNIYVEHTTYCLKENDLKNIKYYKFHVQMGSVVILQGSDNLYVCNKECEKRYLITNEIVKQYCSVSEARKNKLMDLYMHIVRKDMGNCMCSKN